MKDYFKGWVTTDTGWYIVFPGEELRITVTEHWAYNSYSLAIKTPGVLSTSNYRSLPELIAAIDRQIEQRRKHEYI